MIASEGLLAAWRAAQLEFSQLTPTAFVINAAFTAGVLVVAWLAARVVKQLVRTAVRRLPGPATAEKTVRMARAVRFISFVANLAAVLVAAGVVGALWGFDVLAVLSSGPGNDAVGVLIHLILILIGAAVALEFAGFLISHGLSRLAIDETHPRRQAQLQTLGPLLRGLAQSAILIMAVLMALGEIGVKVGPLLAGAGVVGIALGFGAQTLVKDVLTGVFLVIEDIVSVGDVVRIGDSGGLVERMTLRTIRLRDFDGTLHVFPYGEAQVVHNLTKTFSYYVFDLQISYGSDIDRALGLMRQVGDEMQEEPAFAEKILEPIEVVGVDNLADSGVVLKARVKTKPIEQWSVGREYNRRIKFAFDREGIEIPFPHMKVVLPERQLSALVSH